MEQPTVEEFQLELARLGIQAQHFKSSQIGRYLYERAEQEMDDALKERMVADPDDEKANAKATLKYKVAEAVVVWIDEAIASGENAERDIRAQEDMEEV